MPTAGGLNEAIKKLRSEMELTQQFAAGMLFCCTSADPWTPSQTMLSEVTVVVEIVTVAAPDAILYFPANSFDLDVG